MILENYDEKITGNRIINMYVRAAPDEKAPRHC